MDQVYEAANTLVNKHVANKLFDQTTHDYHSASLALDLFLLTLLPLFFTSLLFLFSALVWWATPREAVGIKSKFILFCLVCFLFWVLSLEIAISLALVLSGHGYHLFPNLFTFLALVPLFTSLLLSISNLLTTPVSYPLTSLYSPNALEGASLLLLLWLTAAAPPLASLPLPLPILLVLLFLLWRAKVIWKRGKWVVRGVALGWFLLLVWLGGEGGQGWGVDVVKRLWGWRVVGLVVGGMVVYLWFCLCLCLFEKLLDLERKNVNFILPSSFSTSFPSKTFSSSSSSTPSSTPPLSSPISPPKKKRRARFRLKPSTLFLTFLLALSLSLLLEGMCDKYSPIGWSTTLSRFLSGDLCLSSPCFVYLLLPGGENVGGGQRGKGGGMEVVFHSPVKLQDPEVRYTVSSFPSISFSSSSSSSSFPSFKTLISKAREIEVQTLFHTRFVYISSLRNLYEDALYEFVAGSPREGWSEEYIFRTLPPYPSPPSTPQSEKNDQRSATSTFSSPPFRYVVGGDVGVSKSADQLIHQVNILNPSPSFVVLGGDLAYDNALCPCYRTMDRFLLQWTKNYVNNVIIPFLPVVGNHDAGGYNRHQISPEALYFYYFPYFEDSLENEEEEEQKGDLVIGQNPFGEPLKIQRIEENQGEGNLLIPGGNKKLSPFSFRFHQIDAIDGYILALDSNQVFSLEGEQKEWMEAVMQRWEGSLFRFVAYHNPLYPAAEEDFYDPERQHLRDTWGPIFDRFKIQYSFEFHTHQYKRTWPLVDGSVPEGGDRVTSRISGKMPGTIYLGDGCMGVDSHGALENRPLPWYLARASSEQHFIVVDVKVETEAGGGGEERKGSVVVQAMRGSGHVIDRHVRAVDEDEVRLEEWE